MIQGHVPARVWGFESPLRHHSFRRQYPRTDSLVSDLLSCSCIWSWSSAAARSRIASSTTGSESLEPHRDDPALAPTIAKELAHAVQTGERRARQGWWN